MKNAPHILILAILTAGAVQAQDPLVETCVDSVDPGKAEARIVWDFPYGTFFPLVIGAGYPGPFVTAEKVSRDAGVCLPECPGDVAAEGCDTVAQCTARGVLYCASFTCPPVEGYDACASIAVDNGMCDASVLQGGGKKKVEARERCAGRAAAAGLTNPLNPTATLCLLDTTGHADVAACAAKSVADAYCPRLDSEKIPEAAAALDWFKGQTNRQVFDVWLLEGLKTWAAEGHMPVTVRTVD